MWKYSLLSFLFCLFQCQKWQADDLVALEPYPLEPIPVSLKASVDTKGDIYKNSNMVWVGAVNDFIATLSVKSPTIPDKNRLQLTLLDKNSLKTLHNIEFTSNYDPGLVLTHTYKEWLLLSLGAEMFCFDTSTAELSWQYQWPDAKRLPEMSKGQGPSAIFYNRFSNVIGQFELASGTSESYHVPDFPHTLKYLGHYWDENGKLSFVHHAYTNANKTQLVWLNQDQPSTWKFIDLPDDAGDINVNEGFQVGNLFYLCRYDKLIAVNPTNPTTVITTDLPAPLKMNSKYDPLPVKFSNNVFYANTEKGLWEFNTARQTGQLLAMSGEKVTEFQLDLKGNCYFQSNELPGTSSCFNLWTGNKIWERNLSFEAYRNQKPSFNNVLAVIENTLYVYWENNLVAFE